MVKKMLRGWQGPKAGWEVGGGDSGQEEGWMGRGGWQPGRGGGWRQGGGIWKGTTQQPGFKSQSQHEFKIIMVSHGSSDYAKKEVPSL